MSANDWNLLPYNSVALVAMKTYKGLFTKHDKERFEEYLEKVVGRRRLRPGHCFPTRLSNH